MVDKILKKTTLKGELGELQIYFRKILLHQQKFLVASVLSNLFAVGNTKFNILALTAGSKNKIRLRIIS